MNILPYGLTLAIGVMSIFAAKAQTDVAANFMEKQFYGNRVKSGSVLLNGSFQHIDFSDDTKDGLTARLGFGAGVGLGDHVVLNVGYQRDRVSGIISDVFGILRREFKTTNTFQAGFRFLPNTVGGFIQPYLGLDYIFQKVNDRGTKDSPIIDSQSYMGAQIPVGIIIWISTFMSFSLEPISLSIIGRTGDSQDFDGVFNAELSMRNPTFGINFLLNGKKP